MGDEESGHFSGAHDGQARFGKGQLQILLRKHFGKLNGGGTNTDGSFGNGGFGADAFAGGECVVQQSCENFSTASIVFYGMQVALSDLRENLSFSDDQTVESSGNPHDVPYGVVATEHEQVLSQYGYGQSGSVSEV
jgi:hypothetical protein